MRLGYCERLLQSLGQPNDTKDKQEENKHNDLQRSLPLALDILAKDPFKTTMPLEKLTKFPMKAELYLRESYFRQAHRVFEKLYDLSFFKDYTFIIIRPDAIQAGAIDKIFTCMKSNNLEPVFFKSIDFNRHTISALWQNESNCWPIERLKAMEILLTQSESLFVVLKRKVTSDYIACEVLRTLKGPSVESLRKPGQIRYEIGAKNGLLDFLHFPDEPADIIREMGILFSKEEMKEMLEKIKKFDGSEDISKNLQEQYIAQPLDILDDAEKAKENISNFLEKFNSLEKKYINDLLQNKKWPKINKLIQKTLKENAEAKDHWNNWNLIVFISECNTPNYEGTKPIYHCDALFNNSLKV